jgi:nucleotide-binding universal stress UspA family protein
VIWPGASQLVIACLDEGSAGRAAACVGGALARRLCSRLLLVTVAPAAPTVTNGSKPVPSSLRQARSILLRQGRPVLQNAAVGLGPDPELHVESGEPAERLASLAQRECADLIVVGVPTGATDATRRLGSVYLALAGTSPCPVVIVPPSVPDLAWADGPVICGVDGSDESLAAARIAIELARQLQAPIQLVHVKGRPRLAAAPSDQRGYGARLVASHAAAMRVLLRTANLPAASLDLRVELGNPAECLADIAAREGALMIVNGSQGRGSNRSRLLGSVSSELALAAVQPLVLVPPGANAGLLARPPIGARPGPDTAARAAADRRGQP